MDLENIIIIGLSKSAEVKNKCYSIEEVYDAIKDNMFSPTSVEKPSKSKKGVYHRKRPDRVMLDGDMIKANSQRLQLFYTKGFKCVNCGTEGKFFIKVKNRSNKGELDNFYHLELVGITPSGKYVLMTKDHILPKSKGGKDVLENYQTMCFECNNQKSNNSDEYLRGTTEELKQANAYLFDENAKLKRKIADLNREVANLRNQLQQLKDKNK